MFSAVLFIITKVWKLPKCPSVDKTVMGLYTMEYFSDV